LTFLPTALCPWGWLSL